MRHVGWAAATLAAFLLGLFLGGDRGGWGEGPAAPRAPGVATPGVATPGVATPGVATPDATLAGSGGAALPAGAAALAEDGPAPAAWPVALARLDELVRRGDREAAQAVSADLLDRVLGRARDGEVAAARAMLATYLERNPHDAAAHLLDSDLRQMQGRGQDALGPLLTLLRFADEPAVIAQARDKLELLSNVRESQLANRGDIAGLIRFFEDLSERDPAFDGHRLRLARWLLRAGRLDDARRTLAETGSTGVDPGAREDLAADLALAAAGLPVEPHADAAGRTSALHVRARAQGVGLRLLVDTGATTTAISRDRAAALGSTFTGRRVRVRTAGGPVDAELHRVRDVELGALRLESLDVLVLDQQLPDGIDGLLGMDVLGRFPDAVGGSSRPWQ